MTEGVQAISFDINVIRSQFPILKTEVNGHPLAYLDNAATTQKPQQVIDSITKYYTEYNSNIHRAVHTLGEKATKAYEDSRKYIAGFLNAKSAEEIIFVRGVTEGINLLASGFRKSVLKPGDEIVISALEHHSNIVPWQMACEETGAVLKVIPMTDSGELDLSRFDSLLSDRVKLVSIVHISNALGTVNPVKEIIEAAHQRGIPVHVDGAQSVPHAGVDVQELDVDFFSFSGHKVYGPTGVGVFYGKKEWLDKLAPYQGGGDMIRTVTFEKTIYAEIPNKFEAGTPDISGVIALSEALRFVSNVGYKNIASHEKVLLEYTELKLREIKGLSIIGNAKNKAGAVSFVVDNIHPHDLGTFLNSYGVAIRTGHHCAQPIMDFYNVPATARASFAIYNTKEDIDQLVVAINSTIKIFG